MAPLSAPYRSPGEVEPDILFRAPVSGPLPLASTMAGVVGFMALTASLRPLTAGNIGRAAPLLAVTLAAIGVIVFDSRRRNRSMELRVERAHDGTRLVVGNPPRIVLGPFAVSGASMLTQKGQLYLRLDVEGPNSMITIGASSPRAGDPPRAEWFDGAELRPGSSTGDYMLARTADLIMLRDALSRLTFDE